MADAEQASAPITPEVLGWPEHEQLAAMVALLDVDVRVPPDLAVGVRSAP